MIEEVWDKIVEEFEYFISFEWLSDIGEFFSGFFENITDFSIMGLLGGIVMIVLTNLMLGKVDYIQEMTGIAKITNLGILYIFSFLAGYFPVKRVFEI